MGHYTPKTFYTEKIVGLVGRIPEPGRQKKAGSIQLAPPKEKDLSKIVNVFAVSNEQFFTRKKKFHLEKKMFK